jgi:hypothetical protein
LAELKSPDVAFDESNFHACGMRAAAGGREHL